MWTTGVQGFDTLPSEQFPCHELRQLKEWSLPARRGKGVAQAKNGSGCATVKFSQQNLTRLVVWNMNFIFHNIWDVILPID